jgi:pyridoxamine 5'-phosphate oxidase
MNKEKKAIADLREDYQGQLLEISQVADHPIKQFEAWFQEAQDSKIPEPNFMTFATSSIDGKPSARILLLKGIEEDGFVFFTNYNSRKGKELALNPNAAIVFFWLEMQRQVRIEGIVRKVSEADSEQYFQSRPRGSQIGAWASPQSRVIDNRETLESKVVELEKEFADEEILPLPRFWGGYKLIPSMLEFWQGRSNRLHDRIRYKLQSDKKWKIERLAP